MLAATITARAGTYSLAPVSADEVARALALNSTDNLIRYQRLHKLLELAGCRNEALQEMHVRRAAEPNLVCTLPGLLTPANAPDPRRVIVFARYDHIGQGSGAIDNWSGAAMLPLLVASVLPGYREHTLQFVATYGPEGLPAFLRSLKPQEKAATVSILDLRNLGMDAPRLALLYDDNASSPFGPGSSGRRSRGSIGSGGDTVQPLPVKPEKNADPSLFTPEEKNDVRLFARHAAAGIARLSLPPLAEAYTESFILAHPQTARDEASLILDSGIPGIVLHSVTRQNAMVPGSIHDLPSRIDLAAYDSTYTYASIYLLILDHPKAALTFLPATPALVPGAPTKKP